MGVKGNGNTMSLYKYRSLANLDRTIDILFNQRLYASEYVKLNDPMEGFFYHHGLSREKLKAILTEKLSYRICSLSKCPTNIGLWTFYADEGKGCCIEVEPEKGDWKQEDIDYAFDIPGIADVVKGQYDVQAIEKILCTKLKIWEFEQEVRYLKSVGKSKHPHFLKIKVKKMILGYNIEKDKKKLLITMVEALNKNRPQDDVIEIIEMTRNKLT